MLGSAAIPPPAAAFTASCRLPVGSAIAGPAQSAGHSPSELAHWTEAAAGPSPLLAAPPWLQLTASRPVQAFRAVQSDVASTMELFRCAQANSLAPAVMIK